MKHIKTILLCIFVITFNSCYSIRSFIKLDDTNKSSYKVFILKNIDPLKLENKIVPKCREIGLEIVQKEEDADFLLDFGYVKYFDAIHYTLNIFNVIVYEKYSQKVIAAASIAGDGAAGTSGIISKAFDDLKRKLKA